MAEESLKTKTIKGTFWSAADAFLGQGVTFIVGIILARLLSPEEYGLIGIVLIFTTVLNGIVDSGFSSALIRKKEVEGIDLNTMFLTNMLMSISLFVVLYICAPWIAMFFDRVELVSLTRVMGLVLVINALSIVQDTILTKRIDFKTKTKASLNSAIISGFVGIILALTGFGVWSIVGQILSNKALYSFSLWTLNKWWPNFQFSKDSFHYMWGFGWKLMISGLLNNIWNQLYQVVVGKFYSPATLGQYSRSKDYSNIIAVGLTTIVKRVSYPVFAEMQDDTERMVSAYRKVIKTTMFVTAMCMIPLGAAAEPFIYCLIGPKWHEAATYLPFICISMSLYPLHAINLNMLQVQGRSDIFLYLEIIKKFLAFGPICLGIFINIYWMLVGSIIVGVVSFYLNSYYTGKSLNYSSWMQIKDIAPSYGIAFFIGIMIFYIKELSITYYAILAIQIIVAVLIFVIICKLFQVQEYFELKSILSKVFDKCHGRK